jgi:hypothetical protein
MREMGKIASDASWEWKLGTRASLTGHIVCLSGTKERESNVITHWPSSLPWTLALVLAAALLPDSAQAAGLAFRNDTDSPILVQGVTIINRVARRGKLHVLRPGEVSREPVLLPGTILVTVADAKQPARILRQEPIQFTGIDLFFAIQAEEPEKAQEANKLSAQTSDRKANPKVKLLLLRPTPPTATPPTPRR